MSSRAFCHRCAAEVEDTGGFCLLGHRLSAFAGEAPPPPPPPPSVETPQPAPSRYSSSIEATWAELEAAPAPAPDDPINTFAPPPRMDWGPQRTTRRLKLRRSRVEAPA